ncbi:MAG: hypothetical protein KatS3mg015_1876 [Fimbriimonadales bacterium]|nr:MAG: hypothetical protein KatS3mg015_1876 [Fimbriimonadales bacterium]
MFATLICLAAISQGQPLLHDTFEESTSSWLTLSPSYTVRKTTNALDVKSGNGALEFTYVYVEGEAPLLLRQVGDLTGAKGISLWLKTSRAAYVVLALAEGETGKGERYGVPVHIPANTWTKVEANLDDFALFDDSPIDNRKLDLDKLAFFGVIEVLSTFVKGPTMEYLFGPRTGTNALWLDDFQVLPTKPASGVFTGGNLIDGCNRGYVSWLPLLGMDLTPSSDGLRVRYERMQARIYGMLRGVSPASITAEKELALTVRCAQELRMIVGFEETDGEKWQATATFPGGNETVDVVIPFDSLAPADDSGKADGKFSPNKLKLLSLIDITEAEPGTVGEFVLKRVEAR